MKVEIQWPKIVTLIVAGASASAGCKQSNAPVTNPISPKANAYRSSIQLTQVDAEQRDINKAIRAGDASRVRELAKENPQLLQRQGILGTPLHRAASVDRHLAVVKALLESGADVNARDKQGNTPLNVALRGKGNANKTNLVALLLSSGADPNAKTRVGQSTPLHSAVTLGDIAVVKLLLSHKADVNATDKNGVTPLQEATFFNQRFKAGDPKVLPLAEFFDLQNLPAIIALLQKSGAK